MAAAAELARLLDLDPSRQLQAADAAVPLIEGFVDPTTPLDALAAEPRCANHPEFGRTHRRRRAFTQIRVRQERA